MKLVLSWAALALLLAATLVGAATYDRRQWPSFMGDEATYLMQAESLAFDFDLTYERADFDRFVAHWGQKPDGLILQSRDGGKSLSYGKPVFYSLALAPFVRISPTRGASVANALLLALAAVLAARTLRQAIGDAAPVWVAAFLFGSVAFAYVTWAHADLFLMSATAIGLALAYEGRQTQPERLREIFEDATTESLRRYGLRWAAVGACLAVVGASRPFYLALFLPALLAVSARRRATGILACLGGGAAVALLAVLLSAAVHGTFTSYGGERLGFYSYTGFPRVDLPGDDWQAQVARRGNGSWVAPEKLLPYDFEPRLTAYNSLYFLVGRHVGVLPYFLPLLLGLAAYKPSNGRWALLVAVALATAGFFFVRPMNFYGGGAAIANRYFLPLYPALWFLAAQVRSVLLPVAAMVCAAPFLWPLWAAPRAFPIDPEGGFRYVAPFTRRLLPYETTQEQLKPAGQDDVIQNGIWIKMLTPGVRAVDKGSWLTAPPGTTVELLIGRDKPLATIEISFAAGGPSSIGIRGGALGNITLEPTGLTAFEIGLGEPTARHKMWWRTDEDFNLYILKLDLPPAKASDPDPYRFRLAPQ